mgnify:CR=1 FL=1
MGRMLFLVYKIMGRMRGIYIMDITREKTMRIVNYIFAVLIILCIAVMLLPAKLFRDEVIIACMAKIWISIL